MPNQYETKDMTGTLFVQEPKKTDKHPDFSGHVLIAGREYYLDGWKKLSKYGTKKLINLKVKPKEAAKPAPQSAQPAPRSNSW